MKISYQDTRAYSKDNPSFMLSNKETGNFFMPRINSRYQGFFLYNKGEMYKIIDGLLFDEKVNEIKNNLYNVVQKRGKGNLEETFWMYKDSLVHEINDKDKEFSLVLDIRKAYDNREWGRNYKVMEDVDDCIIIEFIKKKDVREYHQENSLNKENIGDSSNEEQDQEFKLYLVIKGENLKSKKCDEWISIDYPFDRKRNSPNQRHIYCPIRLKGSLIVYSVSEDKEKAVREATKILKDVKKVKKSIIKKHNDIEIKIIKNKELKLSYKNAFNSLQSLVYKKDSLFAGLPWFFQSWTRDELISLKAFIINGQFNFSKKVLIKNLKHIKEDGRLINQTDQILDKTNADSIGWLFKRIKEYDSIKGFSIKEKAKIKKELIGSIKKIKENYQSNNMLIKNNKLETWMDTEWDGDDREGHNIEIQAMYLNMLRFAYELTKDKKYKDEEIEVRAKVKKEFLKYKVLFDCLEDEVVRPNFFIAAYIYPQLLTKDEWIECIEFGLKKLWLNYGGISTIDKNHHLFCLEHTGEIPRSYHRGDSWFFLNNIAAIVMCRVDRKRFKDKIEKIIKADIEEIMLKGITGASSELSSAKKLESNGCLNQAWSNATFIELVDEINS